MWKRQLLALLCVAACDGSTGTLAPPPPPVSPYAPLTLSSAAGKTYVPTGASMQTGNGFDVVGERSATIQIVSPTQINVGGVALTADDDGTTFRSADGSIVMTVASSLDGVATNQMLYALAAEQANGQSLLTPYVMGNATALSDIPKSGVAFYTGKMTVFNDLGLPQTVEGLNLQVGLATADVTGGVPFADTYLTLDRTKLVNGGFYTTMDSGGTTPVVTGSIDGRMYGASGQQIGGTVGLQYNPNGTPTESYVGYYGTTTTP